MPDAIGLDEVKTAIGKLAAPEVFPRADDDAQFEAIAARVRAADALEDKLSIAGFTVDPVVHADIEQACETCMYFLVHRQWCDLPGLDLPVEAKWSCRLWRI